MDIHVAPGSFIDQYMTWMEEQETPTVYDFMCALWCLSIALGRDVFVATLNGIRDGGQIHTWTTWTGEPS